MTWTTLKNRRAGLPLLLAGPILRRVTETSVTVWYAAKAWRTCQLRILDQDGVLLFQSAQVDPVALGSFLSIGCITARAGAGQHLHAGVRYHYDLDFGDVQLAGALQSDSYSIDLSYDGAPYPSFVLPADNIAQLRLVTGSCRKPHAAGEDALVALDQAIRHSGTSPRPQFLLLTGDQIYADDVADALLHCLRDTTMALMDDWDENVPGVGAMSALKPGFRSAAAQSIGFTAMLPGEKPTAKSHLLAFGEYLAMYLHAWSDVLWPAEMPGYTEARGDPQFYLRQVSDRPMMIDSPFLATFNDEVAALERFRPALKAVRRALAHTPTFMTLDDHEVTDDWYMTQRWCESTLQNGGGRRVIANALAAATLCQAWGNDPDQFDLPGGNGRALLNAVSAWAVSKGAADHAPVAAGLVPPATGTLIPVSAGTSHRTLARPPKPIEWHFAIDFPRFRLIALDTRTRRLYPAPDAFPQLIEKEAFRAQLGTDLPPLSIVVLPVPLVAFRGIELVQLASVTRAERLENDCETPGLQPAFYERFLAELATRAPTDPDQPGRRYASVLLVSGDVHFGYMATVSYQATAPFDQNTSKPPVTMNVVQLTASALMNQDSRTTKVTCVGNTDWRVGGLPLPQWGNPKPRKVFGYGSRTVARSSVSQALQQWLAEYVWLADPGLPGPPAGIWQRPVVEDFDWTAARVDVSTATDGVRTQLASPDWEYEVKFLYDARGPTARGPQGTKITIGSESVGHNNFGDIRFIGSDLQFDLWWQPEGAPLTTATRFRTPIRVTGP